MLSLFEDDYSEFDIAWMSKDWAKLQELSDGFKEKPENEFFAILNDINSTKRPRDLTTSEAYSKYSIDMMQSQHVDCIVAAYTMNLIGAGLSDQAHYNYYLLTVPQGKRFSKSTKLTDINQLRTLIIKIIAKRYTLNMEDAFMYYETMLKKNSLQSFLKQNKALATDDLIKTITKNLKEQKNLKKKISEW